MKLRNIAASLRHVRANRAAVVVGNVLACSGLAGFIACSDGGITEPRAASPRTTLPSVQPHADIITTRGDTLIQSFVYTPATGTTVSFAGRAQVVLPAAAICDPKSSGYGQGTWDTKCVPLAAPVTFTVRAWKTVAGNMQAVVSPDVRFVPGKVASLYLSATNVDLTAKPVIQWCTSALTQCVDEGTNDPTLTTQYAQSQGVAYRRIKHFSGYNVNWRGGANGAGASNAAQ